MRIWDLYHLKKKTWKKINMENRWDVCCSPAKKLLRLRSRSKCQDAYRPLVRRDLWPLSHGRGAPQGFTMIWFGCIESLRAKDKIIEIMLLPSRWFTWSCKKGTYETCLRTQEVVVKHDCMTKWCFLSQVQPVSHLRSFSIAAAWFREDTTLHCAFSPSPAAISLEVEYCRANGISMVPRLIGQAPVIALVCEM